MRAWKLLFGSALIAAGSFLVLLACCLLWQNNYEQKHKYGRGSGVGLAGLLTVTVMGCLGLFLLAHARDNKCICGYLEVFDVMDA